MAHNISSDKYCSNECTDGIDICLRYIKIVLADMMYESNCETIRPDEVNYLKSSSFTLQLLLVSLHYILFTISVVLIIFELHNNYFPKYSIMLQFLERIQNYVHIEYYGILT